MALTITLYKFGKVPNSTRQPVETDKLAVVSGVLKSGTSYLNPTLELSLPAGVTAEALNYVYIADFDHYYYVSDLYYNNGMWYVECTADYLASWKNTIGASTQFIERSGNLSDGTIPDPYSPMTADITTSAVACYSGSTILTGFPSTALVQNGYYLIGIANGSTSGRGSISYYVFDDTNFRKFASYLYNLDSYVTTSGLTDKEKFEYKAQFNPLQYIVSCKWYPFQPPCGAAVTGSLNLGYYTIAGTYTYYVYTGELKYIAYGSFTIPSHPQAGTVGAYLNNSPYTRVWLTCTPFGKIAVDPLLLTKASTATLNINVDPVSGMANMVLSNTAGGVLVQECINVSVDIQLAQYAIDYVAATSSLIDSVNPIKAITSAFTSSAKSLMEYQSSLFPQVSINGSQGNMSIWAIHYNPLLYFEWVNVAPVYSYYIGKPYFKIGQISTVAGYLKCANVTLDGVYGKKSEMDEIKRIMEEGFWYE